MLCLRKVIWVSVLYFIPPSCLYFYIHIWAQTFYSYDKYSTSCLHFVPFIYYFLNIIIFMHYQLCTLSQMDMVCNLGVWRHVAAFLGVWHQVAAFLGVWCQVAAFYIGIILAFFLHIASMLIPCFKKRIKFLLCRYIAKLSLKGDIKTNKPTIHFYIQYHLRTSESSYIIVILFVNYHFRYCHHHTLLYFLHYILHYYICILPSLYISYPSPRIAICIH